MGDKSPPPVPDPNPTSRLPPSHLMRQLRPEYYSDTEDRASYIDVHAWSNARWKGVAYADMGPARAPVMAFMFEDREAATKIFERWRSRFGERDVDEEIYLSIVRQLPKRDPNHYLVVVASKQPDLSAFRSGQELAVATRSMTMEPNDSVNIDRFLTAYHRCGTYIIMPAVSRFGEPPELLFRLGIIKREISVKLAANISDEDIEAIALRSQGATGA